MRERALFAAIGFNVRDNASRVSYNPNAIRKGPSRVSEMCM